MSAYVDQEAIFVPRWYTTEVLNVCLNGNSEVLMQFGPACRSCSRTGRHYSFSTICEHRVRLNAFSLQQNQSVVMMMCHKDRVSLRILLYLTKITRGVEDNQDFSYGAKDYQIAYNSF